jgi:hypothetical protein
MSFDVFLAIIPNRQVKPMKMNCDLLFLYHFFFQQRDVENYQQKKSPRLLREDFL